jgi:starvation-inducible DNA-binding protein
MTPSDLPRETIRDISAALTALLADMFALYMKTKNFHWHISGPHFRDYHLLLDEHADQIFQITDAIAERARKIGGSTLRSIGHIARLQRLADNDADYVTPEDMLAELRDDNRRLVSLLRSVHELCDEQKDVATARLVENWIDGLPPPSRPPRRSIASELFIAAVRQLDSACGQTLDDHRAVPSFHAQAERSYKTAKQGGRRIQQDGNVCLFQI